MQVNRPVRQKDNENKEQQKKEKLNEEMDR